MATNSISPRPTLEQVVAMLNFLEKHPNLGLGKLKGGVEARAESKKLWLKLSRVLNALPGPTRPTKSWIKFWSDKKSNVKIKVQSAGGDPSSLLSNIERKIWDLFLSEDQIDKERKRSLSQEPQPTENNHTQDLSHDEVEATNTDQESEELVFELDFEQRNIAIMERLSDALEDQANALAQMAQASEANAQAMERVAQSSMTQARAIERLASTFAAISGATEVMRDSMVEIDGSLKRTLSVHANTLTAPVSSVFEKSRFL